LRVRLGSEIRDILKQQGITALLVTHDQAEAFAVADEIGVMRDGRLEQWDTAYNLYHRPASRFVAEFVGEGCFMPGQANEDGTVQIELGCLEPTEPLAPGAGAVDVLLRPDDIVHDDDSPLTATVLRKAFRGAAILYTLGLPSGRRVLALVPSHHDHRIGERIGIRLEADHVVVFRAAATPPNAGPGGAVGHAPLAAHQHEEQRHADRGGERAHRQLARRRDGARRGVGQHQQRAAAEHGGRHEQAVVRAHDAAHQVRHDQPDEADAAGGRDRDRGQQRAGDIDADAQRAHRDAEHLGPRLAARQHVEMPAGEDPPAMVATASRPSSGAGSRANDRSPISQNSMPRRLESGPSARIRLTAAPKPAATTTPVSSSRSGVQAPGAVREREHQQRRRQGAGEGAAVDPHAAEARRQHQQREGRRAAGDAEHVGIGERVAQQDLHQHPGQRQQAADGEGAERARQAQLAHQGAREPGVRLGQAAPQLARRQRHAAGRQRHQQRAARPARASSPAPPARAPTAMPAARARD
jgi:hypothetical protein